MNHNTSEIELLIVRYLQNTATNEEKDIVLGWLQAGEANEQQFFQMKELYDSRLRLSDSTTENNKIWDSFYEKTQEFVPHKVLKPKIAKKKRIPEWIRYAAVVAVMSVVSYFYVWFNKDSASEPIAKQMEIHNTRGVYQVTLPDGTLVWLHGGTTITYPEQFTSSREIKLDGEAFFKVKSDTKNPFIVDTPIASILATGTEFNVTAYSVDNVVITTLLHGTVDVRSNQSTRYVKLAPGQQSIVKAGSNDINVQDISPELYIDWKDGIYRFKKEPFERIVLQLEKMFGIRITIGSEPLKKVTFSGMFTEDHSLKEVFEIINISNPITYKIKGKDVYIKTD